MTAAFLAHGATLTLAWFVAINAAIAALVMPAIGYSVRREAKLSARVWMSLRLAPAAIASVFTLAFFIPSYWKYEPRQGVEGFDVTLSLLAALAVVMLGAAIVRGVTAWLSARQRVSDWMAHARPIAIAGTALPAYAVDADQPMIALVGLLRPRLLVTRGLLNVLTPAELEAAVAHELGHQRSLDNFKRLLMCSAPDLLRSFGTARLAEQRWAAAAEHLADQIGGSNSAAARCALASALVKVARLTPAVPAHNEPISTLISGGEIAARVQRLLADDDYGPQAVSRLRRLAALASLAAITLAYTPLLRSVHELTEVLVHTLP